MAEPQKNVRGIHSNTRTHEYEPGISRNNIHECECEAFINAALSRTHKCTHHNVPLRQAEAWT